MNAITDKDGIDRIVTERPEQLEGFTVVGRDGQAGKVTAGQDRVDDEHFVVKTGKVFGKEVVVEADVIDEIDPRGQEIHVDRIADWVKSSPKLKDSRALK